MSSREHRHIVDRIAARQPVAAGRALFEPLIQRMRETTTSRATRSASGVAGVGRRANVPSSSLRRPAVRRACAGAGRPRLRARHGGVTAA